MDARQVFHSYAFDAGATESPGFCTRCGSSTALLGGRLVCTACGRIHYRNPAPTVCVLVHEAQRFILGRRSSSFQTGKWCLPCGYVEFYEDFLTAARREVLEETGLVVELTGLLSVTSSFLTPAIHTICVVLGAVPAGGTLLAGDDIDQVEWFEYGTPLPPLAFEADDHIIQRFFETGMRGAPLDPLHSSWLATGPA